MKNKIVLYDVGPHEITTGQDVEVHFVRGTRRFIQYPISVSLRAFIRREYHRYLIIITGFVRSIYERLSNNNK